jgi:transcriptional regulator with XRE-family HTH domain
MREGEAAPGAARAGRAYAARRSEIGFSQAELGRLKIITQPNLSKFERGQSWPRERTRARLEEVVGWPPGTISAIAAGSPVPGETISASDGRRDQSPDARDGAESELASQIGPLIGIALTQVDSAIAALPPENDPHFLTRAQVVLADLRHLEVVAVRAVRSGGAATPAAAGMLATVRRRFDELMIRAAAAPGAPLGQRLYAARRQAGLSADEVAAALEAPRELVVALEAGTPPDGVPVARVEALLAALAGR